MTAPTDTSGIQWFDDEDWSTDIMTGPDGLLASWAARGVRPEEFRPCPDRTLYEAYLAAHPGEFKAKPVR
jgi:hypothetical protein